MNIDLLVPLFAAAVVSGTPLLYATLGELCTEKTGVLNLGVEGVMLVGCLAAFVTARLTGSPWLAFAAAGQHLRPVREPAFLQPDGVHQQSSLFAVHRWRQQA